MPATAGTGEILIDGFDLGDGGEFLRLPRRRGIELLLHIALERIGFLVRGHDGHRRRPAHARDEGPTIDLHRTLLCL